MILEQAAHPAIGEQQQLASDGNRRSVVERDGVDAAGAVRDGDDAGIGADDRAGVFGGPGVSASGRLVIGDTVERGMQATQHLRAETGLEFAHPLALQMHRRDAKGGLHARADRGPADIVMALVQLQVADAFVAGGRPQVRVERRPLIVGQVHQRQLADVAPVGAHATLAEPARRPGRDLPRFQHQHLGAATGERQRRRHTVDAAADDDELCVHVPPLSILTRAPVYARPRQSTP